MEHISIHALREEGDHPHACSLRLGSLFLSTPSARRATSRAHHAARRLPISIHALREEGDLYDGINVAGRYNFYPRPPRGGRPDT